MISLVAGLIPLAMPLVTETIFADIIPIHLKLRWQSNYNTIIGSVQPFILKLSLYYIAVYGMNDVGALRLERCGFDVGKFSQVLQRASLIDVQ